MSIRLSRLLVGSIKKGKLPSDASTTELLESSGYIRKASAGVYNILPLGLRVQKRIESIVRSHLDNIGCQETALASLASSSLWKQSGRFDSPELFKVSDSKYVLAATNEEEITTLVGSLVGSYREMPLKLYQIGKKFRHEKRPRAGLLRGREFTMKDLYTFDSTVANAQVSYEEVRSAYNNIFKDLGVPFVVAEADSGNIGGSQSHEFHYLSSAGEDSVVQCSNCGYTANIERAASPGNKLPGTGTANTKYFTTKDRNYLIVAYYPPGYTLNEILVNSEVEDLDNDCINPIEEYVEKSDPLSRRFIRLVDERLTRKWDLPEPPKEVPISRSQMTSLELPIVNVTQDDPCPSCSSPLKLSNAIEVAHTFYLGTKYSDIFKANIKTQSGQDKSMEMGCYGIGISRLIAAIAEVSRQDSVLRWPLSVSPFSAIIVSTDEKVAHQIGQNLSHHNLTSVWDDRSSQFGKLLGIADSYGMPLTIVAGQRFKESGLLEVQTVKGTKSTTMEDLGTTALEMWNDLK